jgi:High potential iron-sulfur protein
MSTPPDDSMTSAITTRRRFIQLLPLSGLATLAACSKAPEPVPAAPATPTVVPAPPVQSAATTPALNSVADGPMLDEKDATAASLGYVASASRADSGRFPTYASGNQCSSCALYQGAAGSVAGGCPIFVGRRVAAEAWCSSWSKKA